MIFLPTITKNFLNFSNPLRGETYDNIKFVNACYERKDKISTHSNTEDSK
jgi:hypothetical protein